MSRSRLFASLCGAVFLVNLSRVVFAPLLSVFIAEFGVGEATAGLVVTAVWVGSALPRIPTGYLLTRVSRLRVVLASGLLLALGAGLTGIAPGIGALTAGALVMGLASGVYFVAANPFVTELFPERVGRILGIHGTASQLAAVLAAPIVTVALGAGWRIIFLVLAGSALVVTLSTWALGRRTDLPAAGEADRDFLDAARSQWRIILVGVVVLGITGFVWQGVFNFYELYMETKGMRSTVAKNMLTLIFAAGVPAFALSGRLADRFPTLPYLLGVLVTFVALLLALTVTTGFVPLLVLSAAIGLTIHSLFPAVDTYLLGTLPDTNRASAYAIYSGTMMLAQAPGSWVVGAIHEAGYGYDAIFGAFGLGLAGVVAVLVVLQQADRLPN